MLPLQQELEQRGLLKHYTDPKLFELYDQWGQTFYFGMDPTADSLHLGNFVNFMNAIHLMLRGNRCIPLIGWATGMIGDPGGKDSERSFLDAATVAHNVSAIQTQISQILIYIQNLTGRALNVAPVVNNHDFYTQMGYLDFLRDVGKYITINTMITKDTVRKRIEDPEKSISYTEFSYMLLQWYDFAKLYKDENCLLQIAWSDQRGNVVTGIELIHKKYNAKAYGLTCHLVLDSSGKKFGKSEGNALRLDPSKNTPYVVYQYFINVSDDDVTRYLKLFTLLSFDEIDAIIWQHFTTPSQRLGQQRLAYEVIRIIFGESAALSCQTVSLFLFADDKITLLDTLTPDQLDMIIQQVGVVAHDLDIITMAVSSGLCASRGIAKQLVASGGLTCVYGTHYGLLCKWKKHLKIIQK